MNTFANSIFALMAHLHASEEDLQRFKQIFLQLDTDHDGVLNLTELKNGIESLREN